MSEAGICSRRKAEIFLSEERVTINGVTAQLGDKADPEKDQISIDNYPILVKSKPKLILLNKPIGVITTCSDPYRRVTVLELIPSVIRKGLHPVGRLDINSRGAILLTNNGMLTLELTHPRYSHSKTYQIWVEGVPSEAQIEKWRNGIMLDGKITRKAYIELLKSEESKSLLKVELKEGRNRQIRRVAELLGHRVLDLQRTAIGPISLNGLKEGSWRELTKAEWSLLKVSRKSA